MVLSPEKQGMLDKIKIDLQSLEGVSAIVLGGSYAMGSATEKSDLDIGIYYSDKNPFDIEQIKFIAKKYAVDENQLKEQVIQQSLWSAEFTITHADYFSKKQDLYNTMGCVTRALKNIVTAIFALNELYPIGDKRALEILETTDRSPAILNEAG